MVINMILIKRTDELLFKDGKIEITVDGETAEYELNELKKVSVLTTQQRLLKTTVFLVLALRDEIYTMAMNHPDFQHILMEELGKHVSVNYNSIIEAMVNKTDRDFTVYERKTV